MSKQNNQNPNIQQLKKHKSKTIGSYVFGKTLGQGTFGKVKYATHILTEQPVAIKILQKSRIIDVADVQRVSRQIHILKLIRHPNIIQLYEIIQTPKQLFLVMQYVLKGQLFDYIVQKKKLSQQQSCKLFQKLISGIQYIHKINIVHRDLKPQNLLLDFNNCLKIVDFGLSNTYKKDELLGTACGSPCYASPQMIKGLKYNGLLTDIWSSGVILFAMVCGYLPFQDPNTSQLYQKIKSGKYKLPKTVSPQFKHFLSKILQVDPQKRYRIEDMKKHKWWNLYQGHQNTTGIIVGHNRIPIQEQVLQKLKMFEIDIDNARKSIQANRHNSTTTAYYLLLKKKLKQGFKSKADIASDNFDATLLQPIKRRQKNKTLPFNPSDFIQLDELKIKQPKKRCGSINRRKTPSTNIDISRKSFNKSINDITSSGKNIQRDIRVELKSTKRSNILLRQSFQRRPTHSYLQQQSPTNNLIGNRYREKYNRDLVSKSRERRFSIGKLAQRSHSRGRNFQSTEVDGSLLMNSVNINRNIIKLRATMQKNSKDRSIIFKNNLNTSKNSHKKNSYY